MAKIQGNGRPTQFTKGVRGDVYTDLNTGKRYECLGSDGFVGRGQSSDLAKYDWLELKSFGAISGGSSVGGSDNEGGTGGVSSWNDLTDRPFYFESTPIAKLEKQTIEIKQRDNEYGTYFGGITNGFGDIVTSVTNTGKGFGYNTAFDEGNRFVVTIDGVEYEETVQGNGSYGYSFGSGVFYWGDNGPSDDSTWPFYMSFGDTGFILWMSEDKVGSHDISIQVYDDELKKLDEKFIPDTIVRTGIVPYIEPQLPGGPHTIHAGELIATNWSGMVYAPIYLELGAPIKYDTPFILATGEYVDSEGVKHFIDGIKWELTERVYGELFGKNLVELHVRFFIEEPFDYDITVKFVSNYEFRGSM